MNNCRWMHQSSTATWTAGVLNVCTVSDWQKTFSKIPRNYKSPILKHNNDQPWACCQINLTESIFPWDAFSSSSWPLWTGTIQQDLHLYICQTLCPTFLCHTLYHWLKPMCFDLYSSRPAGYLLKDTWGLFFSHPFMNKQRELRQGFTFAALRLTCWSKMPKFMAWSLLFSCFSSTEC